MKKAFIVAFLMIQLPLFAQYEKQKEQQTVTNNYSLDTFDSESKILFNFDWKFQAGPCENAFDPAFDDSGWRSLDIPHDFQFEQPWEQTAEAARGFKPCCEGWYRKTFSTNPLWKDKLVYLSFDGIMYVSDVYVNGAKVASSDYGYIGFEVEISKYLNFDKPNVVAVWASTGPAKGSRWYTGAGLYRDVHVEVKNHTHIARNGIYVTTPKVSESNATVALQVEVDGFKNHDCLIKADIIAPDGTVVGHTESGITFPTKLTCVEVRMPEISLVNPRLWSPDTPNLYTADVEIWADGILVDKKSDHFGVRWMEFSKDFGFKLNGKKLYLKGMANHHDLGALGAASFDTGIERVFQQAKDFGFNTIRCSHNPYSERFTEIADRMGILIVDEFIDKWSDDEYWGGRVPFTNIWYKLIPEWIKRDRNSPSVIMWSLGNELQMSEKLSGFPTADWGVTTYKIFDVLVKRYDNTRKTTVAQFPSRAGAITRHDKEFKTYLVAPELACATDIASFNYQWEAYQGYLEHNPDLIIFQSEATARTLLSPYYGMDRDKMVGYAYWGAVDYWGESGEWPRKGWSYGFFDHTLRPTPQAYLIKSAFIDEPLVRIAVADGNDEEMEWNDEIIGKKTYTSTWNFEKGSLQQIATFTNAEEVELIVNGKSLGKKKNDSTDNDTHHIVVWRNVPYGNGGSIKAVAYNGGKAVATHLVETAGKAVALKMEVETPDSWDADGMDLQYIKVYAVDRKGRVVPGYEEPVSVDVSGAASLYALDNGDHFTNDLFNGVTVKKMKGGYMQIIVRSAKEAGDVVVKATSNSLKSNVKLKTL